MTRVVNNKQYEDDFWGKEQWSGKTTSIKTGVDRAINRMEEKVANYIDMKFDDMKHDVD